MSDEEALAGDLQQTMRIMATIGGQIGERIARLRADAARQQQLEAQERTRQAEQAAREASAAEKERMREQQRQAMEERRQLERSTQQEVAAARTVYGGVRDPRFWREDDRLQKIRVGEALAVSHAMSEFDPLATSAHDYLRREITQRHGDEATAGMLAAMAAYREELDHDVDHATADADQHQQRADNRSQQARTESLGETGEVTEIVAAERGATAAAKADAGERGHSSANASDFKPRDPEAHRSKETTDTAYPVGDRDNINQRQHVRRHAGRREAARPRGEPRGIDDQPWSSLRSGPAEASSRDCAEPRPILWG